MLSPDQNRYLILGNAHEGDGILGELEGRLDRLACTQGIIEAHGEFNRSLVPDASSHANDVRDVLGDRFGLVFGAASVQDHALDVLLTEPKEIRESIDRHLHRAAGVVFDEDAIIVPVSGEVNDLWGIVE